MLPLVSPSPKMTTLSLGEAGAPGCFNVVVSALLPMLEVEAWTCAWRYSHKPIDLEWFKAGRKKPEKEFDAT